VDPRRQNETVQSVDAATRNRERIGWANPDAVHTSGTYSAPCSSASVELSSRKTVTADKIHTVDDPVWIRNVESIRQESTVVTDQ
jgi:hypothetical protein